MNEKLVFVAYLKNSTGYSISLNSTTSRPSNHVIDCLNRKTSWASRILLFGINNKSIMIVITHPATKIKRSMFIYLDVPSNNRIIRFYPDLIF